MSRLAPSPAKYSLPARHLFDLVGTNDLTNLLTVVRGVNPFDVSPGMQLILEKFETRPSSANPFVITTTELDVNVCDIPHARDERGNTALHVAASLGFRLIVESLITECQCDLDAVNADGITPLHAAARHGHLECVQTLFRLGADAQRLTSFSAGDEFFRGRTALFLAHWHQHGAVSAYLAKYCFPVNPMKEAHTQEAQEEALLVAASHVDALLYAQLYDAMDCLNSPCGTLPLEWEPQMLRMRLAGEIASTLIPEKADMVQEQLFIFEGLLRRGLLVVTPTPLCPLHPIVQHVLSRGQSEALRAVILHGVPLTCDPPLSSYVGEEAGGTTEEPTNAKLLLLEAECRLRYAESLAAYKAKPRSKTLKGAAWDAKVEHHGLLKLLKEKSLTPLKVR